MGPMAVILFGLMERAYRCQPFPQASVVDTTGAGDSFHGDSYRNSAVSIRQENALYSEFIKPIDITIPRS